MKKIKTKLWIFDSFGDFEKKEMPDHFKLKIQDTVTNIIDLAFKLFGSNSEFLSTKIFMIRINSDYKLHFHLTEPIQLQNMFTREPQISFKYSSLTIFHSQTDYLSIEKDAIWISDMVNKTSKELYNEWIKKLNDLESYLLQKKLEIC